MNDFVVSLMLLGALSSQDGVMPFWATANRYGLMPESSGGLALLHLGSSFDETRTLQWHWGASAGIKSDTFGTNFIPDELYAGLRWKQLRLDAGMWRPEQQFCAASPLLGTLSVTGGNSMMSGNARNLPGYSFTLEPWDVPFTGKHLQVFGRFGDYCTTDSRYVKGALVHNTSAFMRGNIGKHFSITAGINHYTMWGGDSPEFGKQRITLKNYLRVLAGRSGGGDSPLGDQINSLGDHRGNEIFRLAWKEETWSLVYQYDKPYDDRSGMVWYNYPDGTRTFCLSFNDKTRWISDIVYEYHTTMVQSGEYERRLATQAEIDASDPHLYLDVESSQWYMIVGGADNYCNNYEYRSGWTLYGRQLGNPLFFSRASGMGTWNNLLTAHHFAVSGSLFRKFPYRLMLTASRNHGCWFSESGVYGKEYRFDPPLRQLSTGFETELPVFGGRISLVPAVYFDSGEALPQSFAAILSLKYNFVKS